MVCPILFNVEDSFKTRKTLQNRERRTKKQRTEVESEKISSPSVSGESPEEHLGSASEEEREEEITTYKEPTMYDNLLETLSSGRGSIVNAYKKRQKHEERESDIEDDMGSGSESSDVEEDEGTGINLGGDVEETKDLGTDDEEDVPVTDDEEELGNDVSVNRVSASTSSFSNHLSHIVSKEEVDNLSKRKWRYNWELPISVLPNCKWTGTEDCCIKDSDLEPGCDDLKLRLSKHWVDIFKESGGKDFHSSTQRYFFSFFNSYRDIMHDYKKPFYRKGAEEEMDGYIMHSLNHLFKTRDVVTKNDTKVAKVQEAGNDDLLNGDGFLDQGFTRPKILILLPFRSIALRVVRRMIQLIPPAHKVNVEHFDRFSKEFGSAVEDDSAQDTDGANSNSKPSDFQALFGGNNEDHFMIGIKFTRRSIKMYGDFYSSDVIIASPIGLITKIAEVAEDKGKDVDYLSSIEILIIDHADVITMQNWDHVNTIFERLNCMPSKQHGTNIMRIRQWYLDGFSKFYRQNIILGSYLTPDINASFNYHCFNYQGKVKLVHEYKGVLPKVLLQVQQTYERFDAESILDADDARFDYFTKKWVLFGYSGHQSCRTSNSHAYHGFSNNSHECDGDDCSDCTKLEVFPKIKDSSQGGVMLFINSYFEFLRLRGFLRSQNASFCLLDEYQRNKDISRARVWFFGGKRKIMLYTERSHFHHRYKIRGVRKLIIYSLPDRKEFYPEIVNMLEESDSLSCSVLFSRFDKLRLERIVGSGNAKKMLTSEKKTFIFC